MAFLAFAFGNASLKSSFQNRKVFMEEKKEKNSQGGARKGAGRKPLPPEQRKTRVSYYCTAEQEKKLRAYAQTIGL